ncbi:hypothetical protein GMA19_04680 [Paenibacillus polymyxa E681]|nr:hypothetical protein GE561_04691 [Paenibacillus polymyxa E681]QNV64289.1 hypothetical protein GMA19_04680 [Paenibacillus polymyxa E681]
MGYSSPPPTTLSPNHLPLSRRAGFRGFIHKLTQQRTLVWMSIPFLIWLFIFKYLPIWGWAREAIFGASRCIGGQLHEIRFHTLVWHNQTGIGCSRIRMDSR